MTRKATPTIAPPDADVERQSLEQIQAELANLKARQDAVDGRWEAKLRAPAHPGGQQFGSALAKMQEHQRLARARAAEEAAVERRVQAQRERPQREAQQRKLAPLEARMQAISDEQQKLELELFALGRKRAALVAGFEVAL
jgi:hypothetical protein